MPTILASSVIDGLTAAGVILGLVAVVLGIRHLRDAEKPRKPKDVVHASRWWRARAFHQSLDYLKDYVAAPSYVASEPTARAITPVDIRAWGGSVLLTAASRISRYSQGKANLFVINEVTEDNPTRTITLRSVRFVGAFPITQLTTRRTGSSVYNYRDMPVSVSATATVAADAVYNDSIRFLPIGDTVSDQERRLGTTHILAIPICAGIADVMPGDFAVITVDFRLPRRVRALTICEAWLPKIGVMSRATELQAATREFVQAVSCGDD